MASNVKHLMTVADLEALPDDEWHRYELIEGELYVSCAPGIPHQLVLRNLIFELTLYLKQHPTGTLIPGPGAVFSDYDSVIPDLVFVSNERWESVIENDRFIAAPDLVIEILSPGSTNRSRDLRIKRKLYGKYGVQEYWAVDVQTRSITIFRLAGNTLEEAAILKDENSLESTLLPGFSRPFNAIFD